MAKSNSFAMSQRPTTYAWKRDVLNPSYQVTVTRPKNVKADRIKRLRERLANK